MLMVVAQYLRALNQAGKILELQFASDNLTFDISFYGISCFELRFDIELKSVVILS